MNIQSDAQDGLGPYFHDISTSKPLSREREVALALCIKAGDDGARNELVQANLRFVIDVAKKYQNRGLSLADLISAGNMGLITAAERFDGTRGCKFITCAVWWVRQAILQAIAEQSRVVRLPIHRIELRKKVTRASHALSHSMEGKVFIEAIACKLGVSENNVLNALVESQSICSLDEAFDGNDYLTLAGIVPDESCAPPDEAILQQQERDKIAAALNCLDEREQRIIQLCFGFGGHEPMTLVEIGSLMNLTRERVRQLKERALGKLRKPDNSAALQDMHRTD
ncbi:hypothetical protein BK004_04895 [bacterium CG10_46_32]|nr:MAG: hypothetical protein BK004_04895 [bacterium CG10_46_32]PIR55652.1 MAG: RNA polymerase subunit sigma [Parcubacteria group bacterium CG10_big_fil_rev_8_21_14_0_10_46_32]